MTLDVRRYESLKLFDIAAVAEQHTCYIIPPHITEELKKNQDAAVKNHMEKLALLDKNIRKERRHTPSTVNEFFNYANPEVISVYDCKKKEKLPGNLVTTNKDPGTKDPAAFEAFSGSKLTYDFFKKNFSRLSVDRKNMALKSSIHYGEDYDNAFWNGKQMVYGDGSIFNRFTSSIDVIGHELTHGVVQYEANLIYKRQPGALNESIADAFGSMIKQSHLKQTARKADWLIGKELMKDKGALRSMAAPGTAYHNEVLGKDPQPYRMSAYVQTEEDHGGVHINSGIPNHSFYQAALELDGYSWEKVGKIWYSSLKEAKPTTDFIGFGKITIDQAASLYGKGSAEWNAVQKGWKITEVIL